METGWKLIKEKALDRLESILEGGFKKGGKMFPPKDFSDVYTISYNMCTQNGAGNHSQELYIRHGSVMTEYVTRCVLPALQGRRGEALLKEFLVRAENHGIMNKWYGKFFSYLDRFYTSLDHKNDNPRKLPPLKEAGMIVFKAVVFDVVKTELTTALIALINSERENQVVDRGLIRSIVLHYEKIGSSNLDVYKADFEAPFLAATGEFYKKLTAVWIEENSTSVYIAKVEALLEEERARSKAYLIASESEEKVQQVLERETVKLRINDLLLREGSGCLAMLRDDRLEDIGRMFRLFSKIDVLDDMANLFKKHILEVGSSLISAAISGAKSSSTGAGAGAGLSLPQAPPVAAKSSAAAAPPAPATAAAAKKEPAAGKDKDLADDPQFIKDIIASHEKFDKMVKEQFAGNVKFETSLKDAFTDLMYREVGQYRMTELLASFCDRLLKSGNTEKLSDADTEQLLDKAVQLFMHINDQDMFADLYKNQLAKRLLNQRSASDEMERLMIGKLKLKCGAQFTSKFEGMLNDLSLGVDHMESFHKYFKEKTEAGASAGADSSSTPTRVDFGVQLLTIGHWPTYKVRNSVALYNLYPDCSP